MSRREQAVEMADAEIRRLFAAGYGIFRIAELYGIPRVRLTSDIAQMFDLDWLLEQYPQEYRSLPLMLVYGQDRSISSVCKPVYFCH